MKFKKRIIFNDPNSEPPKNWIWPKDKELLEFDYNTKRWAQSKLTINPIDELKKVIVYSDKAPAKNQLWGKEDEKIYRYDKNSNNWVESTADGEGEIDYTTIPFTIEALESGNINWALSDKTVQYSKNGDPWETMNRTTTISVIQGDKIQFKGNNNSYYIVEPQSWNNIKLSISSTAKFNVKGNIMSLTAGDDFSNVNSVNDYCFEYLFNNCASLVSAGSLILPATTLANSCYNSMFYNCKSLEITPELPATTLANNCYQYMFYGCINLTTPPKLPATTLANNCYSDMFKGCTSLTTAPELPATTLASSCYNNMFMFCANITNAPELPATILASYCYKSMFYGCTNLTTATELPATTLENECYNGMFYNCTSLITAPELPATMLAYRCYNDMFSGCTNLTTVPTKLPATILAEYCYQQMFNGCTNLNIAPELPALTLINSCYRNMFRDCTNLNYIKAMFVDLAPTNATTNWVNGVSPTGTFVKNVHATWTTTGIDGVPTGWTVETAEE